jgi:thiamine-phosphate pyrophosphorylase
MPSTSPRPIPCPHPRPALLGRSCHDPAEVTAAAGCDWVTVSPVNLTASKPGHGPALGPAGLAACIDAPGAPPVYALGGLGRTTPRTACAPAPWASPSWAR